MPTSAGAIASDPEEGETSLHAYYAQLPSFITATSVHAERNELINRVHETVSTLKFLRDASDDSVVTVARTLQKRHLRAVKTLFVLKHTLPKQLHFELIELLLCLLWERDGTPFSDVDMETCAARTLNLLLRKWRTQHNPKQLDGRLTLRIPLQLAIRAVSRVNFRPRGYIAPASSMLMQSLATAMRKCIDSARRYLCPTARSEGDAPLVVELWENLAPQVMDVASNDCFKALGLLSLLLNMPSTDGEAPAPAAITWCAIEGLLPAWFEAWAKVSKCTEWDGHWFKVLSRVSKGFPAESVVALRPYVPFIFAKVHDMLRLPSDLGVPFKNKVWPSAYTGLHGSKRLEHYAMQLCVGLVENPTAGSRANDEIVKSANQYILELLHMVKAFFHPSNASNIAHSLGGIINYLITALSKRLGRDKAAALSTTMPLLSVETCRPILDAVLELCFFGIYSKSGSVASSCMFALKRVLCVDPAHCMRPVMDEMVRALNPHALSQSHMAPAAISSLSMMFYHALKGKHPDGTTLLFAEYLSPILRLTLAGIDANDEKKTRSTVTFYFHLLSWLPLVNDTAKKSRSAGTQTRLESSQTLFHGMEEDLFSSSAPLPAEMDVKLWELGSFLEEWTLELLDRCLRFIRSRTSAHVNAPATSTKDHYGAANDAEDAAVMNVINMMSLLFAQMSPAIYQQAMRKTLEFVSNSFFATPFGGKVISSLISEIVRSNPKEAVPRVLALVSKKMNVSKFSLDVNHLMTNEKVWFLYVLDGAVRINDAGSSVLQTYRSELETMLAHFLRHEDDKKVYEIAGQVLQHLLEALLDVYPTDFRSLPSTEWDIAISEKAGAFQFFGAAIPWKNIDIKWHEPTQDELEFAYSLLETYLLGTLGTLQELRVNDDVSVRAWIPHLKRITQCIQGTRNVLVDDFKTVAVDALQSGSLPLLEIACDGNAALLDKLVTLKRTVMDEVHALSVYWHANGKKGATENQVWSLILTMIKQLLIWHGSHLGEQRSSEKRQKYMKSARADAASQAFRKARRFERDLMDVTIGASRNDMIENIILFYGKRKVQQHFELTNRVLMDTDCSSGIRERYEALLEDVAILMKNPYKEVRREAADVMQANTELYAKWIYSGLPQNLDILDGKIVDSGAGYIKEESVLGAMEFLQKPIVITYIWRKRGILLKRTLTALLKSNENVISKLENESSKAKLAVRIQEVFLVLLASWSYVCPPDSPHSFVVDMLAIEPSPAEHWKQQLLHLVIFYPVLQGHQLPFPIALWELVIKHLRHDVLPVRQLAVLLFSQLLILHKKQKRVAGIDVCASAQVDTLIFAEQTIQALLDAFVNNHRSTHRFATSTDGQHDNSAPSDWSFGVTEVIRYLSNTFNMYPMSPPLSSVRLINQNRSGFKSIEISHLKLVERLTRMSPRAVVSGSVLDALHALTGRMSGKHAEEERQAAFATVGEWVGGIIRGLVKLGTEDDVFARQQVQVLCELLQKTLPHVTVTMVGPWSQMLYYVSRPSSRNHSLALNRLEAIVKYVMNELKQAFECATDEDYAPQVKWLTLVEPLLVHTTAVTARSSIEAGLNSGETATMTKDLRVGLIDLVEVHALAHQYKMVRDRAARVLFILHATVQGTRGAVSDTVPLYKLVTLTDLQLSEFITSDTQTRASTSVQNDEPLALNAKETAMMWLSYVERYGDAYELADMWTTLFPVAFLTQNHPKVEMALLATNTTNSISLSLRLFAVPGDDAAAAQLTELLEMLEKFSLHPLWKTRGAVLRFITSFAFYHWVFFSHTQKHQVQSLIMTLLSDDQREVQDMAKYALRSLVHVERLSVVSTLSAELMNLARESRIKHPRLMRRLLKQEHEAGTTNADEIEMTKERLRIVEGAMSKSVLALSAIVLAFPYSVPDCVPPIFEELGRYLYIKHTTPTLSFLEKTVKDTLLEFKRVHQDTWLKIKLSFTEDQRSVFEDVLISPSYFS